MFYYIYRTYDEVSYRLLQTVVICIGNELWMRIMVTLERLPILTALVPQPILDFFQPQLLLTDDRARSADPHPSNGFVGSHLIVFNYICSN